MRFLLFLLYSFCLVLNYQQSNAESVSEYNKRTLKIWKRDIDFLSINKLDDTIWEEVSDSGKKILWHLVEDGVRIGEIELADEARKAFLKLTPSVAFLRLEGEEDFTAWSQGEWLVEPADFNKKLHEWKFKDFPDLYFKKLSDSEWVDDEGIRYSVARDNERVGEIVLVTTRGYYKESEWKKLTPHYFYYAFDDRNDKYEKGLKGEWLNNWF